MDSATDKRNEIINYISLRLGSNMVDVELDKEHYDMAINQSMIRYRQLAPKADAEGYVFLDLVKEQTDYILPSDVRTVRQVFRRGIGTISGNTSTNFEPFSAGYLNTYMLVGGQLGGLLSYELFADYQKQTMKMFGGHIMFTFDDATKKLSIVRKIPVDGEQVALWVYVKKNDQILLNDDRIFPWLQDYAYAMAKFTLGEAREKFAQSYGPQGGTQMNGTAIKAEGQKEMDGLIDELRKTVDGSDCLTWILG